MPILAIVAAFVVVVLGAITATVTVPTQAAIGIGEATIVIKPVGLMRLWALSKGTTIPFESVTQVGVADRRAEGRRYWRPPGIRLPGAYLPGVICAGTYRRTGVRELWMVGRSEQAVAIETTGFPITRVIVQVADPVAAVGAIRAALGR